MNGNEALAYGALEAGVEFVTGYPGSPVTATVEAILRLRAAPPFGRSDERVRAEWAINEKSAFDTALGTSLAGVRSLICLKSVGLNVALDSLMVANLATGDGGLVVLAGDDPGGWGSQNEQDSRPLAAAAEVPLLEPPADADVQTIMLRAFDLSERFHLPVVVRITRALATADVQTALAELPTVRNAGSRHPARFQRHPNRFNVLPIHVVEFHRRLQATLGLVQVEFERLPLNTVEGSGSVGVVACGYAGQKLAGVLEQSGGPPLRVLRLGTLYPLPERRIVEFLRTVEQVLVLEETAPYVETEVQAIAQRAGLNLPILGRRSGHVPGAGELFAAGIAHALVALLPGWAWPSFQQAGRNMPSRTALCENCSYIPTFEALLAMVERNGGRNAFVITGETGCMVRAQLPPWELLDVKYGMGASIGLAAGLARSGIPQRVVALSGDSALFHSGLGELIDAAQAGANLLVVVLANGTTALSGGQPHPATALDAAGQPRRAVDLAALIRAAGAPSVCVVDPDDGDATRAAFEEGLAADGVSVVIAEKPCARWEQVG
jgi:indolepyruvate ferredoxin oxidoreductase alpha subunit